MAVTISDTGLDWRAVIVAFLSVCLVSWLIVSVCNWLARTVRQIAALVFSERQPAATRNPHHRLYVPESVSDSDTQALTCSIYERALAGKQVVVVNSEETWSSVADRLTSYCRRLPILGLDCEWLPNGFGFTGPDCVVALLQLATLDGLCVLVQLSQFDIDDCPQLEKILGDKDVLKVGVAVREDCRRLWLRCFVPVAGCVDLRRVADLHQHHHAGLRDVDAPKTGLAKLAEAVLDMQVAKDKKVTLSRWNNEQLSREQKEYAANDALYSVLVFAGLLSYNPGLKRVFDYAIDKHLLDVPPATDALWWHCVHSACEGLVEKRIQPAPRYSFESVGSHTLPCSIYERALAGKQVVVVNSEETWSSVADRLTSYCRRLPILGLDCEWLPNGFGFTGLDCVVALLQLATLDGLCVLVQLSQVDIDDCPQLEEILGDKDVLKVGVAVREDCRMLCLRCRVPVAGCVDLRRVAARHQHHHAGLRDVDAPKTGLAKLAEAVLDMQVAKDKKVTLSRWDNEQLSREQKEYAANDALYSVLVFAGLLSYNPWLKRVFDCAIDKHLLRVPPATDTLWWHYVHSACEGLVEDRIQPAPRYSFESVGSRHSSWQPVRDTVTDSVKSRGTRQTHLYDNARLLDPDGHPLSVVDERKAKWYLRKNLAKLVCESPLTVRLLFEPAGRPQGEGRHGAYYLLEKLNQCVCCGAGENYARKNIVPQEYRKHFPEIMKSHQSHDVLLLCVECHRHSAVHDLEMKRQLAKLCNAPFNSGQNSKVREDALKSLRSAARALLSHRDTLPETRYVELDNMLSEYFGCDQLSDDQLAEVVQLVQTYDDGHVSHGERVCGFYGRLKQRYNDEGGGGLVLLEKRWRRHFLESMRPRFMPRLWSVDHNHVKIATKLRHADWPAARKRAVWRQCFGAEYPCLSQ